MDSNFSFFWLTPACTRRLDLVFVLDLSGSMKDTYKMIISFARTLTYGFNIDQDLVRIGVVTYSSEVADRFYLNTYTGFKPMIITALNFYYEGGMTDIQGGLDAALNQFTASRGDRTGVRDVIILVTDGHANLNTDDTQSAAEEIKARGIDIYTVALGETPNTQALNSIASDPDTEYSYSLKKLDDVDTTADRLLENLCQ